MIKLDNGLRVDAVGFTSSLVFTSRDELPATGLIKVDKKIHLLNTFLEGVVLYADVSVTDHINTPSVVDSIRALAADVDILLVPDDVRKALGGIINKLRSPVLVNGFVSTITFIK